LYWQIEKVLLTFVIEYMRHPSNLSGLPFIFNLHYVDLDSNISTLFFFSFNHMPSIVLHYVIIASITVMFVLVNRFYGHKTSINWKENNEQL